MAVAAGLFTHQPLPGGGAAAVDTSRGELKMGGFLFSFSKNNNTTNSFFHVFMHWIPFSAGCCLLTSTNSSSLDPCERIFLLLLLVPNLLVG